MAGIMRIFHYRLRPLLLVSLCVGLFSPPGSAAPPHVLVVQRPGSGTVVRERQRVVVGSAVEEWRLEWKRAPEQECDPSGDDWYTCPCSGFAFGESGELDLVRLVPGKPAERLPLSPLFALGFDGDSVARLPRWPVRKGDFERKDSPGFSRMVKSRPVVRIMNIGDYDHDGRPTEFALQVGAGPCGHRQTVLVGITRLNPKLHAFGTVAHPGDPLVLESPEAWQRLLVSRGRTTVVSWPCGDHGAEEEVEIELVAAPGGLRAIRSRYACIEDGRGRLLERLEQ
ncbi:MAG: hypothetical protein HGA56_02445 [Chlorobiaceae bacterium]|nr:hypothetical protein [Chlorobiaceae bacterium]